MPWCPKCKMEYVSGITTCADCNVPLEEDFKEEAVKVSFLETEKEQQASKFVKFLKYSNVDEAVYEYDDEKGVYIVSVYEDSVKRVKKLYNAFFEVESKQVLDNMQEKNTLKYHEADISAASEEDYSPNYDSDSSLDDYDTMFDKEEIKELYESKQKKPEKTSIYVKKEEQYKDLRSSAITFLIVSIAGLVVLLLNLLDVIHIFYGILPLVVMGGMFLAFLLVGISSFRKSVIIHGQIEEENQTTDMITQWLLQNVTLEQLEIETNPGESYEVRFYHHLELMKQKVNNQFGELNDSYLERLLEEFYNEYFDVNS